MIPVVVKKRLSNLLIASVVLTSLTITPYITFDPFNPPKLLVLTTISGICSALLIPQFNRVTLKNYLLPILASLFFVSALLLSTVLSEQHLITTLYGVTGRHTGALAYLSFIILYVTAVLISSESLALKIAKSIIFVSVITIVYSWIQVSGIDPAPWSEGGWVMAFFSNPNFLSSFLGISAASAFAFIFDFSTTKKNRIFLIIYALLVLVTIVQTKSIQGLIVYVTVFTCVLYLKINSLEKLLKFKKYYISTVFVFFTWAVLDILQKTPGESVIYKLSVSSRGDFWRAAWKMSMDKPFFGWGLDSLRDRFELYRDSRHATRGEGHMLVEIAHNVFLDMLVGGGFLLLIAYLILVFVSLFRLKSFVFKTSQFNVGFASVFAIAIGFLAQSTISANHLGLAVWGWISLGILAGYNKNASGLPPITKIDSKGQKLTGQSRLLNSKKTGIFGSLVGFICGFAVSMPLVLVNTQQQSAVDNQNPNQVFESALAWPQDLLKMCILAERLKASGFESEALTITRKAREFTPYSVVPLKILLTFNSITEEERNQILKEIKIMDPYFELAEKTRSKQLKN